MSSEVLSLVFKTHQSTERRCGSGGGGFVQGIGRHSSHFQTSVSSEFGVAVCVALYRDQLLHAGGATFVERAVPDVTGRSPLLAPTEDIRHGVGATLDVGAAQEGATVVT